MWINEYLNRHEVVQALTSIRKEWEEAADGMSLSAMQTSVGLLMMDIVSAIKLTSDEQMRVLGDNLVSELHDVLVIAPEVYERL